MTEAGGNMVEAFVNLGDLLHKNSLSTISVFGDRQDKRRDREQRQREMELQKELEEKRMSQTKRGQDMQGLEALRNRFAGSEMDARRKGIASLTLQALGGRS